MPIRFSDEYFPPFGEWGIPGVPRKEIIRIPFNATTILRVAEQVDGRIWTNGILLAQNRPFFNRFWPLTKNRV